MLITVFQELGLLCLILLAINGKVEKAIVVCKYLLAVHHSSDRLAQDLDTLSLKDGNTETSSYLRCTPRIMLHLSGGLA